MLFEASYRAETEVVIYEWNFAGDVTTTLPTTTTNTHNTAS